MCVTDANWIEFSYYLHYIFDLKNKINDKILNYFTLYSNKLNLNNNINKRIYFKIICIITKTLIAEEKLSTW